MSLLMMSGEVLHVLLTPTGTTREGREYGGDHQVQILGETPLRNGEIRKEMVTLRTDHPEAFKKLLGQQIAVEIGAFVRNGAISYYMQQGAMPRQIKAPVGQPQQ